MPFECPICSSRRARFSHVAGWKEKILRRLGWYALRCQECGHRYLNHILGPSALLYAKCPRCYRMDLSSWDPRYYRARAGTRLKLALGAERMRCESCRCNFASFRKRRRWYRRPDSPQDVVERTEEAREAASGR